ncbi:MAG: carbohydrate binding domain-containing protein [Lentisphaerota bacterium]
MKTLRCIVLMLLPFFALVFIGTSAETDSINLFPNPGFEEGEKMPAGWTVWQGGDCCTFVWDKVTAHSGTRSLYVCNADKEGSLAWTTSCNLKSDTSYRFSAWIKIRKGKNSNGVAAFRARGRAKGMDKKWDITSEARGNTENQWQLLQWDFKTPPGLEGATALWLWSINGRGDQVWFDDVELRALN